MWSRGLQCTEFLVCAPLEKGDGHGLLRVQVSLPKGSFMELERRGGRRQWSKGDWDEAREIIFHGPDSNTGGNTSESILKLTEEVTRVINTCVPLSKEVYVRPWAPAWFNRSILEHSSAVQRARAEWRAMKAHQPHPNADLEANPATPSDSHAAAIAKAKARYTKIRNRRGWNL